VSDQDAILAEITRLIESLVQAQSTAGAQGQGSAGPQGQTMGGAQRPGTTKTALCVGINAYAPGPGAPSPLRGCVNDALLIGGLLRTAGFEVRQIHDGSATQAAILDRLEAEIAQLRDGDYFVFWNSSHGYQVTDRSGDELFDVRDECACTYDTDPRDPLTDDKFARILGRAPAGATVFFGSDSCHSGTLSRLLRDAITQGDDEGYRQPRLWIPPDDIRFRSGPVIDLNGYLDGLNLAAYVPASAGDDDTTLRLRSAADVLATGAGARDGIAPTDSGAVRTYLRSVVSGESDRSATRSRRRARSSAQGREGLPQIEVPVPLSKELRRFGQLTRSVTDEEQMNHLLLSGCRPEEVSYDAGFPQGFHGAMTYNFATAVLRAWRDGTAITYAEAWNAAQQGLDSGSFNQHPQLEGPQALKDSSVFGHTP
jgi:Caspase domain